MVWAGILNAMLSGTEVLTEVDCRETKGIDMFYILQALSQRINLFTKHYNT